MNEFNEQNIPGQEGENPPASTDSGQAGWTEGSQAPTARTEPASPQDRPQARPEQSPQPDADSQPPRYGGGVYPQGGYGDQGYRQGGYPPYSRPPQGNPQPPPPGQQGPYNPYQYNANSGWQQQYPPRPQEKYEWKFEDYEKLDNRKGDKKRPNRGLVVFTVALICLLSVGLVALAGYSIYTAAAGPSVMEIEESAEVPVLESSAAENHIQIAERPDNSEAPAAGGKLTIPQVAEAVMPSVVGVIKYDNNQYFEMSGYGSGIVMSADGYIITNAHVVMGGTGFKVQFSDGDAYDAALVGFDSITDLAVVKIEAEGLVPAQFGDSESLRIGEPVVAIGNPGGDVLANSVTYGVVSAVNREVYTTNYSYKMNYIQTDAAINPGNSGGALANEYGQVIGINSAKITATGYEGIGFAIPISAAKPVIDDIIANGRVTGRVMLGISSRRVVDEVDARNYGIQMGVMIDSVENDDLIAAGVLKGDILTHIGDTRIYNLSDIRETLDRYKASDTVTLTFYRKIGTKEQTYEATCRLMESQ